jgi:hypothetical protein
MAHPPSADLSLEIRIDPHTLERAEERGANLDEINNVVSSGFPLPAKYGRNCKGKVYDFKASRLGRYYEQKRVEVIYTVLGDVATTVTVYVFFGTWEEENASPL